MRKYFYFPNFILCKQKKHAYKFVRQQPFNFRKSL